MMGRFSRPLLLCVLLFTACSEQQVPFFSGDSYPAQLADWQLFNLQDNALQLASDTLPYELKTPLFSDYALKLRTIRMPPGTKAEWSDEDVFDLPVGTVISKTFYYQKKSGQAQTVVKIAQADSPFDGSRLPLDNVLLVETRLLVHQADGWDALPYVWNAEQTEARLQITGDLRQLSLADGSSEPVNFVYSVPNRNECANCHAVDQNEGSIHPIGPAARHLDRPLQFASLQTGSQLALWQERNLLQGYPGRFQTAIGEARHYLDINCGHCHQRGGSADTSGLFLNAGETSLARLGVCKPPVAAGRGTGGRRFSITPGQPENSILSFRLQSRELDIQMPELGRNLVHAEGVAMVNEWISQLQGDCMQPAESGQR